MHIIVAQGYRRLLFCLGLFLTLVACESGSSSNPGSDSTVSSVRVDKQSTKLPAGVTQQLSVQAVFSDGTASDVTRQVKWAVEPLGIVDIDGQGRLLAKEVGTVNITATFVDTTSDSIAIEVSDATITGLALTPKVHHMTVNATNHHVAAALFSDESAHDVTLSPHTQYHVSQEDVIRVESGKVFAVGPGQASIAAIFGDEISMVEVIVADNAFDTLALLPQGPTDVPVGQTIKYRLMASHHDHSEPTDVTTNTDVQWSVSGSGAADFSIDDGGVALKASLEGLVTLTASLDQITTDSSFSVVNAAPTALSLELATPEESWPVGRQPVFNVFVTYSDGEVHPVTGDDWRITWKSEDTSVATVSEGIVTTLKPGVVTINASFDDSIVLKEASETIEVVAAIPERLLISVANGEPLGPLPIGATRQYTALVAYTNGDTHTVTNEALWYAEPIYGYGEVEVGQGDNGGQVVAREVGQVSIAADWQMLASAANETVDVVPAQFLSLELRTPTDVVGEGLTLMLTAYAHYTDEVIPVILDMYTLSYESTGGDIDVAFSAEGVSITGLIKGTVELKGTYTSEKTGGTHEMFKTITVADNFYTVRVRVYDDGLLNNSIAIPGKSACYHDCTISFPVESGDLRLTAYPGVLPLWPGLYYRLTGWSGPCNAEGRVCTVTAVPGSTVTVGAGFAL